MFTDSILIKRLIVREYQLRPLAELTDYYKLFYQSFFGPGHFISNPESALSYLQQEMDELGKTKPPINMSYFRYIQDITYNIGYSRINLELVRKGVITVQELCDIFVSSANEAGSFEQYYWLNCWNEIENIIAKLSIIKTNFAEQRKALQQKMENKEFVLSHSKQYRALYQPHYRVVRNDLLPE